MFHFYLYNSERKIIVSDFPQQKVKDKFGYRYEILTSVKEKEAIELASSKLLRTYPSFTIEQYVVKERKIYVQTEQHKANLRASLLGKPRSPEVRAKISASCKGRSNFQGKSHTKETKARMAERKLGNKHTKDTIWAHDPRADTEVRVRDLKEIPKGFSKGRDYYSTEPGLYYFSKGPHQD